MTFDITIPVLNEEPTLDAQVRTLHRFLSDNFSRKPEGLPRDLWWKIIIADNGSTDKTPDIARALEAEFAEVQLVKVPKRGVGLALKTSWGQSDADIVGYMDLDLATDLKHFPEALTALTEGGYDLVYATRLHRDSMVIGRSLKREISSRGFNFILKNYLNTDFSDGMCGFKWLRREVYPTLYAAGAQNDGWFFSTELLTTAEWNNLKIKELPVQWTDDAGSSKVKILPLAKRYLSAMKELKKKKP